MLTEILEVSPGFAKPVQASVCVVRDLRGCMLKKNRSKNQREKETFCHDNSV
jgi:hypothetical protein